MDNVGVVVVKEGEISAEELEKSFNDMWKANWLWQIRQIGPKKFLVRFPPSKRIKKLVEYPSINLKKEGVVIYFENWEGEAEPFEEFQEIWVKIIGIPAKWLTWKTICQVSTTLGETIDVDEDDDEDPGQSNEGDKLDDDAEIGDDFKALDKSNPGGNNNKMETDPSFPSGGRSVPRSAAQLALETSVQDKVFGKEPHIPTESALVLRSAEENIGKNRLQHFEAEEAEDAEGAKGDVDGVLSNVPEPSMPSKVWKEKKQWEPVQATRMSSRIPRDGKTAIKKAQDLKKAKNLEIPKGTNT
ncbi:hypothetical protein QYE76_015035 [Lolium multiflorum]|uniref:DUF4283 domain-containing protein n=1 Tax=Lolium multiflorum TaxID=4521 RepID=A0AAD8U608_LOLMU|nr:hypothetical protein QYE76_015035 [Lolium multiflorum]